MGRSFKQGVVAGICLVVIAAILAFFAVGASRPLVDHWWNQGFIAGYDRALKHCQTHVTADCGD